MDRSERVERAVEIVFTAFRTRRGEKSKPFCDRVRSDPAFLALVERLARDFGPDAIADYLIATRDAPEATAEIETILRLEGDVFAYVRAIKTV